MQTPMQGASPVARMAPNIPPSARKDEDIIEQDVGKAARQHRCHRKFGGAVAADKTDENVVEEKCGRKEEEHPQVGIPPFPELPPSAPRRVTICLEKRAATVMRTAAIPAPIRHTAVKTALAPRPSPRLFSTEKRMAPPMPRSRPRPCTRLYEGIARLSAATPFMPMPSEIKKVSARI